MKKKDNGKFLRAHINKFWPTNNKEEFMWRSGPISTSYSNFSVCQVEPKGFQNEWVYLTVGASEIHSPNNDHSEFFILAPMKDPIHIDTLAMVASFHSNPKYGISLGNIIEIGRPWIENSKCEYFLVSLPYTIGKEFEYLQIGESNIRFLWLLPITESERDFFNKYGQEALEKKFDEIGIEYLNPNRQSVI